MLLIGNLKVQLSLSYSDPLFICVLWHCEPGLWKEVQGSWIDLYSFSEGRRTIIENVAKMGLALSYMKFDRTYVWTYTPLNRLFVLKKSVDVSVSDLRQSQMIVFVSKRVNDVVPKGRIATRTFELVFRHEKALATARAWVDTCVLCPPVGASEWSLSTHALSDIERVRSKFLLQAFFHLSLVLCQPFLEDFLALELSGRSISCFEDVMDYWPIRLNSDISQFFLNWSYASDLLRLSGGDFYLLSHVLNRVVSLFNLLLELLSLFLLNCTLLCLLCTQKTLNLLLTSYLLLSLLDRLGLLSGLLLWLRSFEEVVEDAISNLLNHSMLTI